MPIPWGIKRQLSAFAVFATVVLVIVAGIVYFFRPEPTCFDDKQNQGEDRVDCGGPCSPCAQDVKDLAVLWSRVLIVKEGVADAAALIENQNQFLGSKKLVYAIKLYDEDNILVAVRENTTFVDAGGRFLIFEPNIITQERAPNKALIEIRDIDWEVIEPAVLGIDVLRRRMLLTEQPPRLEIDIKNQADETHRNIEATVVLFGARDEVKGFSRTVIDKLDINAERTLLFTWPQVIDEVERAEIMFRNEN
jgi:hypothetical protein